MWTKTGDALLLKQTLPTLYSPSRTRTCDIMINSHALLPTELWVKSEMNHVEFYFIHNLLFHSTGIEPVNVRPHLSVVRFTIELRMKNILHISIKNK